MNRKSVIKFLISTIVIYLVLALVVITLTGTFTLRRTELLLLPAVITVLSTKFYENKNYFYSALGLFFFFASLAVLKIKILHLNISVYDIVKYFSCVIGVCNIFILAAVFTAKIKCSTIIRFFILILMFIPVILIWGYYFTASSWLNVDAVMAIMQTNVKESAEYLHDNLEVKYYIVVGILFIILYFLNNEVGKLSVKTNIKSKKLYCAFILILCLLSIYKGKGNLLTYIAKDTVTYLQRYDDFNERREIRKKSINNLANFDVNEKGIYVLVIGESQNKNYMSAYGYERETTPWLSSIKNNSDVVFFSKAHSCHTHTVPVLTYALTAKNQYNKLELSETVSLIEVAEAAGFDTVWLSNQVKYGFWDTPITVIASEANQQQWINDNVGEVTRTNYYDGKLVDCLDNIKYSDKMLIVIHLMGNHGSYGERYPAEFERFTGDNIVDEYDNSILYNDYFVQHLYEKISKMPEFKVMVYFADHADAVKEKLGHDASRYIPEMTDIPFYICLSDNFIKENPDKFQNLKNSQSKYFTNDLIFNTMLSLMNIKIDSIYEPQNDIVSQQYDDNITRFKTLYGKKGIGEK